MTLYGAAEYLHCNPSTVYELLRNGEVRGFKLGIGEGSDWRIFRGDLEHWIEQHQVNAAQAHDQCPSFSGAVRKRGQLSDRGRRYFARPVQGARGHDHKERFS